MFDLSVSESLTAIAFILMLCYTLRIVTYVLNDDVTAFKQQALAIFCQWQANRGKPKTEEVIKVDQSGSLSFDLEPLVFEIKTDPEWQHLYIPTYQRQGRVLSIEQG